MRAALVPLRHLCRRMSWRDSSTVPFSRIGIVSQIPSESGVYAIYDGQCCVFVGEAWNLKARLLELASVLVEFSYLSITFELCPEAYRADRKKELTAALLNPDEAQFTGSRIPGLLGSTGLSSSV